MQSADHALTAPPADAADGPRRRVDLRYLAVAAAVVLVGSWYAAQRRWGGDFWLHNAVVAELVRRPFDPQHPLLPVDASDHYFSPYALAVAGVARLTGATPLDALTWAGTVNLVLLLGGLWWFVTGVSRARQAPFWTLVATLLWWGPDVWRWSGYLNAPSLALTSPYPATFATAAALGCLGTVARLLDGRAGRPRIIGEVVVASLVSIVVLSHAFTAVWLLVGVVALVACRWPGRDTTTRAAAGVGLAVLVGGLLPLAWPYYPITALLGSGARFDDWQEPLAEGLVTRAWPAVLLGTPFLVRRFWLDRRDPLATMAAALAVLVVIGALTEQSNLLRVATALFLVLLTALGEGVALAEARRLHPQRLNLAVLAGTVVLTVVVVAANVDLLRPLVVHEAEGAPAYTNLEVAASLPEGAIVLADYPADLGLPGFGPVKQVGTPWPAPFVDDAEARLADTRAFFADDTSTAARRAIIERWGATHVLIPHDGLAVDPATGGDPLDGLGLERVGDSPAWAVYRVTAPTTPS